MAAPGVPAASPVRCVDHDLHLARIARISDLRNINREKAVFQISDQGHPAAAHRLSKGCGSLFFGSVGALASVIT